jgi:dihydrofolate reductase
MQASLIIRRPNFRQGDSTLPDPKGHCAHQPRISIIAAVARNRVIGRQNTIPWHLPEDLKHFRALTMGNPIIMGRRTWESLGRPLPGRRNLVISRGLTAEGCEILSSLDDAIAACTGAAEAFVIGGAAIYAAALGKAHRLLLTELDAEFDGDTFFPSFDRALWQETTRERHQAQAGFEFDYVTYCRAART